MGHFGHVKLMLHLRHSKNNFLYLFSLFLLFLPIPRCVGRKTGQESR